MNKMFLSAVVLFMVFITVSCQNKNPANNDPVINTATITATASVTQTATITPTATRTPNTYLLDDFNDGDMMNYHNTDTWNQYWPFDGQWAAAPVATEGITGYALKVTGFVTANTGSPGNYYGFFGTTTNPSNDDMRPVNYLNVTLKFVPNVPGTNTGNFTKIETYVSSASSFIAYDITPMPATTWQVYKIPLSSFTVDGGTLDGALSAVQTIGIYAFYYSATLDETAQGELYVDNIFYSEE